MSGIALEMPIWIAPPATACAIAEPLANVWN
jgi:hypothetical protein